MFPPAGPVKVLPMSAGVTTLDQVAAFVPSREVTVESVAEELGFDKYTTRMFRRVLGVDRLREDPASDVFDLVLAAAVQALRAVPDPTDIRYLLFAHTVPEVTPSQLDAAQVIAHRLGLARADAFALTQQNCASGLAAIDVAGELLRAEDDPRARALVVTGEKLFTSSVRVAGGMTIMGEASGACVVGLDGGTNRVRSYVATTLGVFAEGLRLSPDGLKEFNDSYADELAAIAVEAVARAELSMADVELVVPHNVNRLLWLKVLERIGLHRDRIYLDNLPRYSHCWCSDPLLNLTSLHDAGRLVKGRHYLLTAVGLGSTYAAMVIEH
jgi:3-oxoacyl-[acyl-carrier-protein] synthase-3